MPGSKQAWVVEKEHGIWKRLEAFNLCRQTGRMEEGFLGLVVLEQARARTSQEWEKERHVQPPGDKKCVMLSKTP